MVSLILKAWDLSRKLSGGILNLVGPNYKTKQQHL